MKSKMLKVLGAIGLVVVVAALLMVGCAKPSPAPAPTPAPAPAPTTEVTEWKFQPCYGPGVESCWKGNLLPWIDMVEKATKGTVKVTPLAVGSIASSDESFPATQEGAIDVWAGWATVYGGIMPEGMLAYGQSLACEDSGEAWEIMWGNPAYRIGDIVQEAAHRNNVHWAGWTNCGFNQAFTNFPVTKWEDFQGHKMRAGGPQAVFFDAMGGSTVAMPWGDIYMSIKLGTIEGLFGDIASIGPSKLHEVVKYEIRPAWNAVQSEEIFVNLDSWNALEQWQRDAIMAHFEDHFWTSSMNFEDYVKESRETCYDYGVEVLQMSDEEIARMTQRVVEKVWPGVAELSPDCARGIEIYKQFLRQKGRL